MRCDGRSTKLPPGVGARHRGMGALRGGSLQPIWIIDMAAREAMLFAAAGLLIGGIDDLAVDLVFLCRRLWRRAPGRMTLAELPRPERPARLAMLVPAWDEAAVIGAMLDLAVRRFGGADARIYVGLYPNDPATRDAALRIARRDRRVRLVTGTRPGPTTKADCLNTLWRAVQADIAAGHAIDAVVLHDAEDVVHPSEHTVFAALMPAHDVVQLPVLPLIHADSRMVSAHYADEFAEAHGKAMVVRTALGAGMPLAGTGCAIAVAMLARIAAARGGDPFDAASLVEDYELGLRIAELGGRGLFAAVTDGGAPVAVRSYFPGTLGGAVRQKARWMTGIALAGWDRTGWAARPLALADHWMRLRDRRAPLAVLVLAVAYLAGVLWATAAIGHAWAGTAPPGAGAPAWLLGCNVALLVWRLMMRMICTGRVYGRGEALASVPRFLVGNAVSLAAAPRALLRYLRLLGGAAPVWDKTAHEFPAAGTAR